MTDKDREGKQSDKHIVVAARNAQWETFVFTVSGKAKRVALIFDRDGQPDIDFRTMDADQSADNLGQRVAENWERARRPEEETLRFVRALDLGEPKTEHVLIRLAATGATGELFRCTRCSRIVEGHFNPAPRIGDMPYGVNAPRLSAGGRRDYEKWAEFWKPCKGVAKP